MARIAFVVVGAILGLGVAVGLSALKPEIGFGGLVGFLILGALTLGGLLAGRHFLKAFEPIPPAEDADEAPVVLAPPWLAPAKRWSGVALALGLGCFVPCVGIVAAESLGPTEGFVKRSMNRAEERERQMAQASEDLEKKAKWDAEAPARDEERKKADARRLAQANIDDSNRNLVQQKERAWQAADLILVNPGSRAVALKRNRESKAAEYTLLNKAGDGELMPALMKSWESKIPIITDPELARRIYEGVVAGKLIREEEARELERKARFRPILPVKLPYVGFTERVSKEKRFGHLLGSEEGKFTFVNLLPRRDQAAAADALPYLSETLDKSSVDNYRVLTESELKRSADTLDFFLLRGLAEMQARAGVESQSSWQVRPYIYVDDIYIRQEAQSKLVRDLTSELTSLRHEKLRTLMNPTEPSRMNVEAQGLLPALALLLSNHASEVRRERDANLRNAQALKIIDEQMRAIDESKDQVERLQKAAGSLKDDLRKKLTEAGIPIPDRSVRARDIYLKLDPKGERWTGSRPDAQVAFRDGFDQASHMLLADVGPPQTNGSYHLTMNLIEFRTGSIVWSDHADRDIYIGNVFLPSGVAPTSIAGNWKCPGSKMRVRIGEKDGQVEVTLISDDTLEKFVLVGQRKGNAIKVSTCYIAYQPRQNFAPGTHVVKNVELRIIDGKRLILAVPKYEGKGMDGKPVFSTMLYEGAFEKE